MPGSVRTRVTGDNKQFWTSIDGNDALILTPMTSKLTMPRRQLHQSQIERSRRYIRQHFNLKLSTNDIAKESGASPFHFARIFLAYTGLTPFEFLRSIRLTKALHILRADRHCPITAIALAVGYETPSAFNKAFKKSLGVSPSEFRKLGQARQAKFIHDLERSQFALEMSMPLKMNLAPEIVIRPDMHYLYVEKKNGAFQDIAQQAWPELMAKLGNAMHPGEVTEYLGLSTIDRSSNEEETTIYQAGVALPEDPSQKPKGLHYKKLQGGRYAKFLLRGSYTQLWVAFSEIFRSLSASHIQLRDGFCIENYLNDPRMTPEAALLTEILLPIV